VRTDKEKHAAEFMQETRFIYTRAGKRMISQWPLLLLLHTNIEKPFVTGEEDINLGT
jgi:hypothetical protein